MSEEFEIRNRELKMSEDEFKRVYEEHNKRLEQSSEQVKKILSIILGILAVSFAVLQIVSFVNSEANQGSGIGNYTWLIFEFIVLVLLFYDPKVEDQKRYVYENNKRILLTALTNKIKINKIRKIAAIALGILFAVIQGFAWAMAISVLTYKG